MQKRELLFALRVGGILLLVAALTALLIGTVYRITAPYIAANEAAAVSEAVSQLFPDAEAVKMELPQENESVLALYRAERQGEPAGYAVQVKAQGYGGDLLLMVGVGTDGRITSVLVLSHSETPGIGSKVLEPSRLAALEGVSDAEAADAISGATYSSRALRAGLEQALSLVKGGQP